MHFPSFPKPRTNTRHTVRDEASGDLHLLSLSAAPFLALLPLGTGQAGGQFGVGEGNALGDSMCRKEKLICLCPLPG